MLAHLVATYRHSSEAVWRERLERGEVALDGVTVRGDEPCRAGHLLTWRRPPWEEPEAPLEYGVAYEDEALLAVIKPAGLPTVPSGGFLEHTLLHRVRARFPGANPLHRLGRGTSGLVLFSRSAEVARRMGAVWGTPAVLKRYRALAQGRSAVATHDIHAAIGEVPHPRLGSVFAAREGGKPAHSTARVLALRDAETLFEVDLHTGRPDQIRIHLAYVGHPLVGDPLFTVGGVPRAALPGLPGDTGYHLHAAQLAFPHPLTGEPLTLWAEPPAPLR